MRRAILSHVASASLAIAILSLLVASGAALLNRRAINAEARDRKQEADDRRKQLDLLEQQLQGVVDRESRELSGAVTVVCAELVRAAELADAYHAGSLSIQDVMSALPRDAWQAHRQALAGLLLENPIRHELLAAEDALDKTKSRGADPPTGDHLKGLASRLDGETKRRFQAGS